MYAYDDWFCGPESQICKRCWWWIKRENVLTTLDKQQTFCASAQSPEGQGQIKRFKSNLGWKQAVKPSVKPSWDHLNGVFYTGSDAEHLAWWSYSTLAAKACMQSYSSSCYIEPFHAPNWGYDSLVSAHELEPLCYVSWCIFIIR